VIGTRARLIPVLRAVRSMLSSPLTLLPMVDVGCFRCCPLGWVGSSLG